MNQSAIDITSKFIPKQKQFEDKLVSVVPFTARKGLNLQLRLIKIIGPAIKSIITQEMVDKIKAGSKDMSLPIDNLIDAFQKVMSGPNSEELFSLIIELLSNTSIGNTQLTESVFDITFVNDYLLMYKILFFVLEVNFSDLLKMGNIGSQQVQ